MPHDNATLRARPTVYKGTRMRSRLEAGFAMWLDRMRMEWEYEPHCLAGSAGQWLPDFQLTNVSTLTGAPGRIYVEVKPRSFDLHGAEGQALRDRMVTCAHEFPDVEIWPVLCQEGVGSPLVATRMDSRGDFWAKYDWIFMASDSASWRVGLSAVVPSPWQGEWWKGGDA